MTVVGTLVVGFGEDAATASGALIAEWDDSKNLDTAGEVKSQFVPGDQAWLLLHNDGSVVVNAVKVTAGAVVAEGAVSLSRTDELGFGSAGEPQDLGYLPAGSPSFAWYGNVGSGATVDGKAVQLAGGQFPCLADVTYPVQFSRYRIQTPVVELGKDETYPLRVYVYYTEVEAEA